MWSRRGPGCFLALWKVNFTLQWAPQGQTFAPPPSGVTEDTGPAVRVALTPASHPAGSAQGGGRRPNGVLDALAGNSR